MIMQDVDAQILFTHQSDEVAALTKAAIPMAEYIAAVARSGEKTKFKAITGCQYFRARDARIVRDMLLRACKYARAHLCDYFPTMQGQIMINAETLENATDWYWADFQRLKEESVPVH
jgi:hypothetical protein